VGGDLLDVDNKVQMMLFQDSTEVPGSAK